MRDELWYLPHHCSGKWKIPELYGDDDANHAAHIASYKQSDLPWDKIEHWLRSKKDEFLANPPLWMSSDWFDYLPSNLKENVWTDPQELENLIEKCIK